MGGCNMLLVAHDWLVGAAVLFLPLFGPHFFFGRCVVHTSSGGCVLHYSRVSGAKEDEEEEESKLQGLMHLSQCRSFAGHLDYFGFPTCEMSNSPAAATAIDYQITSQSIQYNYHHRNTEGNCFRHMRLRPGRILS